MANSVVPVFTLSKTFSMADSDFDAEFILDLLQNRGFRYSAKVLDGNGSVAKRVKVKRRRSKMRVALTQERINEFRKARSDGKSYPRIGKIFGVSAGRAWQIVNRGRGR